MATSLAPEQRAQLDGIVQKMQANGETDDYIQSVVNDFKTKNATPLPDQMRPAPVAQAGMMGIPPWAKEALPSVGGFIGGAAGGVLGIPGGPPGMIAGGIGGAALGGSAGEIIRRGIGNEPMDPRAIAGQGLAEGGYQALGGALAKGAAKASPFLARRALSLARRRGGGLMDVLGGTGLGQMMGGHAVPGALAGATKAIAQSPRANAALSKLLASPKFQRAARQSPRAAAALVQQMLLTAEPDALAQP